MEPSPFVANLASIIVISLALFSFFLMFKMKGKYVDIVFGFILAIVVLLKIIYWQQPSPQVQQHEQEHPQSGFGLFVSINSQNHCFRIITIVWN